MISLKFKVQGLRFKVQGFTRHVTAGDKCLFLNIRDDPITPYPSDFYLTRMV